VHDVIEKNMKKQLTILKKSGTMQALEKFNN